MRIGGIVRRCAIASLVVLAYPATARAQRRQLLEFTRQSILVANFHVAVSTDPTRGDFRFGRRVADRLRDELSERVKGKEARVIPAYETHQVLERSAFSLDTVFGLPELWVHGQILRADEIVTGSFTRLPNAVRLEAALYLWRDLRLRQRYEPVTAPTLEQAAAQLAAQIHQSRTQLGFERRCENSLRMEQGQQALRSAREGIAAFPRGMIARTCVLWALDAISAPPAQILEEAQALLAIDSTSAYALEAAALALDTLGRRDAAADMWLRLAATEPKNLGLIEHVVFNMAEGGNAQRAEPLIVRVSDQYPDSVGLLRQKWRVANDNRNWALAIAAGERLLQRDPQATGDSTFYLRLANAYRADEQPLKAIEVAAHGVWSFRGDARLYTMYAQLVKEESDSVIARGLTLHPASAELQVLNAQDLRARGRVEESLDASKRALQLDSTLAQGRLLVAQAELDVGRPDSAIATMRKALEAGENTGRVALFALSKGNGLLRTATASGALTDFIAAMSVLAFADSLEPTPQAKLLLGVSAVSVAQLALMEAPSAKEGEERCRLSRLGSRTLPVADAALRAGSALSPESAKQYLEYLELIRPFAPKQLTAFCSKP